MESLLHDTVAHTVAVEDLDIYGIVTCDCIDLLETVDC